MYTNVYFWGKNLGLKGLQGFAESLQHCIRPRISITALYASFSALNLPYKEVTEL